MSFGETNLAAWNKNRTTFKRSQPISDDLIVMRMVSFFILRSPLILRALADHSDQVE